MDKQAEIEKKVFKLGKSVKRKHLPLGEKVRQDQRRENAINMYREMKKRKEHNRTDFT